MNAWPHDTTSAKNAFYGDFLKSGWASMYLIRIVPPFKMYYEKQLMTHGVLVNKQCASAMLAAFNEIWDKCNHDQAAVDKTGVSDYAGCFNIRKIAGTDEWTNHSWACAIDLSPETNGFRYNSATTLSHIVIDAFKRQNFRWGGDYRHRKDPMHFEAVQP